MASETVDFRPKAILEVLAKHGVDYVVLGGIASVIYGSPFPTSDVDVVPELKVSNLDRLAAALKEMDARILVTDEPEGREIEITGRFLKKNLPDFKFLHFKTKYGQLDILYKPAGTDGYRDLVRHAESVQLGGAAVRIAALEDIIRSKQAAGRERDLEQLPTLRKLLEVSRQGEATERRS